MAAWLNVWRWLVVAATLTGPLAACTPPPDSPPPLSEMPAAVAAEVSLDLHPKWPRTAFQLEITTEDKRYVGGSHSTIRTVIDAAASIEPAKDSGFETRWQYGELRSYRKSGYARSYNVWDDSTRYLENTRFLFHLDANGVPDRRIVVEGGESSFLPKGTIRFWPLHIIKPHAYIYFGLAGSFVSGGVASPFRSAWTDRHFREDSIVLLEKFDRRRNRAIITVQRGPYELLPPLQADGDWTCAAKQDAVQRLDIKQRRNFDVWSGCSAKSADGIKPEDGSPRWEFQTRATYRIDLTTGLPDYVVYEQLTSQDGKLDKAIRTELRVVGGG